MGHLYSGGDHRFLAALKRDLSRSREVRWAVSFILSSGVGLIAPALKDLLRRPGRVVKILTTDYLGVTEPDALQQLLALPTAPDSRLELRSYSAPGQSFHPKAYLFRHMDGARRTYIGSSNLSASALQYGIEWNWALAPAAGPVPGLESASEADDLASVEADFDELFYSSPTTVLVTTEWIKAYRMRRVACASAVAAARSLVDPPSVPQRPIPNPAQEQALAALDDLREAGETRGLVVAATGLGKTYLAAFDSCGYRRVLFIAHRSELLDQAQEAFERIRGQWVGRVQGDRVELDARVVVAMVQTLSQTRLLDDERLGGFDYVVVDEFHHAAADSYRKVIDRLNPRFLLGLTATPYRGDSRDLFALVGGNIAYEIGLFPSIERRWLVPFHYFGIADTVDYTPDLLNTRRTGYDDVRLTAALSQSERIDRLLTEWHRRAPSAPKALGFCVSIEHAETMAAQFSARGIPSSAVHSGPASASRRDAIEGLVAGRVQCLFTVDLFNEGVDIPPVNLVLMLRPTESMTVFAQQLGRGLRLHEGKTHLVVLDFIGNDRNAQIKLPFLVGRTGTDDLERGAQREALKDLVAEAGRYELPGGIWIELEERALTTLATALRARDQVSERLKSDLLAIDDLIRAKYGRRPRLDEVYRMSAYSLPAYRQAFGSWSGALRETGWLSADEAELESEVGAFLKMLEVTAMTKSYKMVVLSAMWSDRDGLQPRTLTELAAYFRTHFGDPRWRSDLLGTEIEDIDDPNVVTDDVLASYIERNPVKAWAATSVFSFDPEDRTLRYTGPPATDRVMFSLAIRERIDARLAQYHDRREVRLPAFKVLPQGDDRLCIMFGESAVNSLDVVPRSGGWKPVDVNGLPYWGKFVKVALNILKPRIADEHPEASVASNMLTEALEELLAGVPDHQRAVTLQRTDTGVYRIERGRRR